MFFQVYVWGEIILNTEMVVVPLIDILSFGIETYYRSTNDSDTLDHVVELISAVNPNQGTYRPALAVIVTWDHQAAGASPRFFSNGGGGGGGGGGHTIMSIIRELSLPPPPPPPSH